MSENKFLYEVCAALVASLYLQNLENARAAEKARIAARPWWRKLAGKI